MKKKVGKLMDAHGHKWDFYKDSAGEWRWRRTAANGDIVGVSVEGYKKKEDCIANASMNGMPDDLENKPWDIILNFSIDEDQNTRKYEAVIQDIIKHIKPETNKIINELVNGLISKIGEEKLLAFPRGNRKINALKNNILQIGADIKRCNIKNEVMILAKRIELISMNIAYEMEKGNNTLEIMKSEVGESKMKDFWNIIELCQIINNQAGSKVDEYTIKNIEFIFMSNKDKDESDIIDKLINKGEGKNVEFKELVQKNKTNIFKSVISFLNTDGGKIVIGITDKKEIIGVEDNFDKDGLMQSLVEKIGEVYIGKFVEINIIEKHNKKLCLIDVKKSDSAVFYDSKLYARMGATNRPIEGADKIIDYHNRYFQNQGSDSVKDKK